ncbi:MAG TPA: tRNA lysidine(34) synthetase TilS [Casimicrobiaceae bacterium]|nr:tRNA lysidine(34) synthetase TilS [Casimicrobiaceae bacterium]
MAVALSGGRDSCTLLDACAALAPAHGVALAAIHVHHGLSAHADAWADACRGLAAQLRVPLDVRHVQVAGLRRHGIEAAARHARYAALREGAAALRADAVALAHHEDDQAETLLLQALRGAGPHGLAAMPARARDARGVDWIRPLLDVPRAAIDAYAARRALAYVDDDSNASTRHRRNALRIDVMPALARAFPSPVHALARAASLQAEAAGLLDDLAVLDAGDAMGDGTLACARLESLPPARGRNVLRWFLRSHGLPAPPAARLASMLAQLARPRADAQSRIEHAGRAIGVHRGRIHVHAVPPPPFALRWHGEAELALPHGRLAFVRVVGEGLDAARLGRASVTIASRRGGERFTLDARRPRRALAAWLYDAGLPAWARDALPLVVCDGEVVAVPTLGVDPAWRACGAGAGWRCDWHPDPAVPG